jgi:hypothetical protein
VAVEIEIHPVCIAAAFGAAQQLLIKMPRLGNIPNLHGDVEGRQRLVHDD